jgi:hypothetical protein
METDKLAFAPHGRKMHAAKFRFFPAIMGGTKSCLYFRLWTHFDFHVEMARWRGLDANRRNTGVHLPALHVRAASSAHEDGGAAALREFAREIGRESESSRCYAS